MCPDLAGSRAKMGEGRGTAVTWHQAQTNRPEAKSWRLCGFTNAGKKLCRHFSAGGDLGPTAYHLVQAE